MVFSSFEDRDREISNDCKEAQVTTLEVTLADEGVAAGNPLLLNTF